MTRVEFYGSTALKYNRLPIPNRILASNLKDLDESMWVDAVGLDNDSSDRGFSNRVLIRDMMVEVDVVDS